MSLEDHMPPINWFGGMIIARHLLSWTKGDLEDEDTDSYIYKLNNQTFINRVMIIVTALHQFGPTLQAAEAIQANGDGFFTDVSSEALAEKLQEGIELLQKAPVFKFRVAEFGSLVFEKKGGC